VIRKLEVPKELGDTAEVRVLAWHKREGEPISVGDALVELEADKAILLISSKQTGFLRRCFAAEGEWLKVGEVAAFVSDHTDEAVPERAAQTEWMMAAFETT